MSTTKKGRTFENNLQIAKHMSTTKQGRTFENKTFELRYCNMFLLSFDNLITNMVTISETD